jgi:hypothetical protein
MATISLSGRNGSYTISIMRGDIPRVPAYLVGDICRGQLMRDFSIGAATNRAWTGDPRAGKCRNIQCGVFAPARFLAAAGFLLP